MNFLKKIKIDGFHGNGFLKYIISFFLQSASTPEQEAHGQQHSPEKPFLRVHKIPQST